jgi:hypothetical protein
MAFKAALALGLLGAYRGDRKCPVHLDFLTHATEHVVPWWDQVALGVSLA